MTQNDGRDGVLTVEAVRGFGDTGRFLRLAEKLYREDPHWVAPLRLERRLHLSRHNPYFEHAEWQAWVAWRGRRPVGRISAQVDRLYLETHGDRCGFFGFLEAEDDPRVFGMLFDAAQHWLRERGMERVAGPFSLSINDECGLLVEGFETPPAIMMPHHHRYYADRVTACGYRPEQDLLAYRIHSDFEAPPAMRRAAEKLKDRILLRPMDHSALDRELEVLRGIFNDAWSENWGFVPFTAREFRAMGRDLSKVIDRDFVQIAEIDGEPAGMIVLIPNLNELLAGMRGRLLPLGWWKLLRLDRNYPGTARVPLMGVKKRYQNSLVGAPLAFMLVDALCQPARRRGIGEVELSWILEGNSRMRRLIESLGGGIYKRYRIYGRRLNDRT